MPKMREFIENIFVFAVCVIIELFLEVIHILQYIIGKHSLNARNGQAVPVDGSSDYQDTKGVGQPTYDVHWTVTKPVLLCISVWSHVPHLWSRQKEALSDQFLVVPVDLNDLVKKHFKRRHFKLKVLAEHCVDIAHSLGASEFSVMAHGVGVHLAWALGALHPRKVKKIIMVSGSHPSVSDDKQCLNWRSPLCSSQRMRCFVQLPYLPEISYTLESYQKGRRFQEILNHCQLEDEDKAVIQEELSCKDFYISSLNYLRSALNPLPFCQDKSIRLDVRVSCPVLFILGDKDKSLNLQEVCYAGQFVEKFHCKVIEGCGSYPHWDDPEAVNSCILGFLEGGPTLPTPKRNNGVSPVKDLVSKALKGGASAVTATMYSCVKTVAGGTMSSVLHKSVPSFVVNGVTSSGLVRKGLF